MTKFYAFIYQPGEKWLKGKSIYEQPLAEHGAYMNQLVANGQMTIGGPFTDNSGGMAIIKAGNDQEAEALLAKDPAITSKVFMAIIRPWQIVFGEPEK